MGKEVRNITDELPFEIPESWVWTRMLNLVRIFDKSPFKASEGLINGEFPFYTSSQELKKYCNKAIYENGITMGTGGKGSVNICLGKFSTSTDCFNFTSICINLKYLFIFLSGKIDYISQTMFKGVGLKHLQKDQLLQELVPLPPINEQSRIIKKIEKCKPLLEIYKSIEGKLNILEDSFEEKLKASILQYAIEGKLVKQDSNDEPASVLLEHIKAEKEKLIEEGKIKRDKHDSEIVIGDDKNYYKNIIFWPIPKSWCITNLGFIGEWRSGSTPNRSEAKNFVGPIPWLKTGDLNDSLVTNIPEHISEEAFKRNKLRLNPINTILIAMYGATIGKLGILGLPSATNQACCSCIVYKGLNYKYLFYYLMSQKKMLIDKGAGGAQPNISKEKIINHPILVPPYNEQLKIVKKIEHLIDLVA